MHDDDDDDDFETMLTRATIWDERGRDLPPEQAARVRESIMRQAAHQGGDQDD